MITTDDLAPSDRRQAQALIEEARRNHGAAAGGR